MSAIPITGLAGAAAAGVVATPARATALTAAVESRAQRRYWRAGVVRSCSDGRLSGLLAFLVTLEVKVLSFLFGCEHDVGSVVLLRWLWLPVKGVYVCG